MLVPNDIALFGQTGSQTSQLTQASVIFKAIAALCRVGAANALRGVHRLFSKTKLSAVLRHADLRKFRPAAERRRGRNRRRSRRRAWRAFAAGPSTSALRAVACPEP